MKLKVISIFIVLLVAASAMVIAKDVSYYKETTVQGLANFRDYIIDAALTMDSDKITDLKNEGHTDEDIKRFKRRYASLREAFRTGDFYRLYYSDSYDAYAESVKVLNELLEVDPEYTAALIERGTLKELYIDDYEGAIEDYDKALGIDPDNLLALKYRGLAKNYTNDHLSALNDLSKVISKNPDDAEVLIGKAKANQGRNYIPEAIYNYNKAFEIKYPTKRINKAESNKYEPSEIVSDFGDLLEIDPDDTDALFNRGYARLTVYKCDCKTESQLNRSLKDFNKLLDIIPDDADALKYRAITRVYLNYLSGTIEYLEEILSDNPDDVDVLFALGYAKNKLGDTETAIEYYDKALRLKYFDRVINSGAAKKYADNNVNYLDEAVEDFGNLLKITPDDVNALFSRGYAHRETYDRKNAMNDFNRALEIDPDDVDSLINRGIMRDYWDDDSEGALEDYNKALSIKPDFAKALINIGHVKSGLGNYDEAIIDYDRGLILNPEPDVRADLLYNRAVAKDRAGDNKGAIEDYSSSLEIKYAYEAMYNRGTTKKELGDLLGAISDFNIVLDKNPDFSRARHHRGIAKIKLGDYAGAVEDFNEVLLSRPDDDTALAQRGKARLGANDIKGAISDYDKSLLVEPYAEYALRGRADAKEKGGDIAGATEDRNKAESIAIYWKGSEKKDNGDFVGAMVHYTEALRLDPNNLYTLRDVASIKLQTDNPNDALEYLDRTLEVKPDDEFSLSNRGYLRLQAGDFEGAIEDYSNGVKADPEDQLTWYNMAYAKHQLGDNDGALRDVNAVLAINPDYADALILRGVIKRDSSIAGLGDDGTEDYNRGWELKNAGQ